MKASDSANVGSLMERNIALPNGFIFSDMRILNFLNDVILDVCVKQ